MIDTNEKLAAFLPTVRAAKWIAVDTEADSLHAYPEKVCLIQISTVAGDELVDPLGPWGNRAQRPTGSAVGCPTGRARLNLASLLDALNAHELIMHGADYDLRLLRKHHEFVPSAVFDTMLAARLLGQRQFGLQSLVETWLGVKLEKGSQKANWARRPLTERMEQYARNDTHHLKPLADKLKLELQQKGRLAWHQEACARLIDESTRLCPVDLDSVWRVKGSHGLSRPALAVLRELWHWRESEALASNRPPFFILSHDLLVDLAAAAAAARPFEPLVPRHLTPRRCHGLTQAIQTGLQLSADKHPKPLQRTSRRPSEAERRRFAELEKHRNAHAHRLDIDPTLIASRATLSDLARCWNKHAPELMSWQRELLKVG